MKLLKNLFLGLLLAIGVNTTVTAQEYSRFGAWSVQNKVDSDGEVFMSSHDGDMIMGRMRRVGERSRAPFIFLYQGHDGEGYTLNFNIGRTNMAYDSTTEDKNYIELEFMADRNKASILKYQGRVFNNSGAVNIRSKRGNTISELYSLFRSANDVYVRISTSVGPAYVFKINANGFIAADAHAEKILQNGSDPFGPSSSDDPF